jgi:cyclophilin family peptidyl-prolyl cis-trans isomerase
MASSNVYFKISIGGADAGNLVFKLFDETTPKTAQNFRALCTGD